MGLVKAYIDKPAFEALFIRMDERYFIQTIKGFPPGAKMQSLKYDTQMQMHVVYFEHPDYDSPIVGQKVPEIELVFQTCAIDMATSDEQSDINEACQRAAEKVAAELQKGDKPAKLALDKKIEMEDLLKDFDEIPESGPLIYDDEGGTA